jgi:hypothetical protein
MDLPTDVTNHQFEQHAPKITAQKARPFTRTNEEYPSFSEAVSKSNAYTPSSDQSVHSGDTTEFETIEYQLRKQLSIERERNKRLQRQNRELVGLIAATSGGLGQFDPPTVTKNGRV